jgi:thymidylate synthase
MNNVDKQYIKLCKKILAKGNTKSDRTGTGTVSLFGEEMRFDLAKGFPLLTTKSVHFKSVVGELLWFLRGDTNIKFLQDNGIKIWDAWSVNDDVGKMYGYQWRNNKTLKYTEKLDAYYENEHDQIAQLIYDIKQNPDSRRLLVSAWNVGELNAMALAPCHYSFQCYVSNGKLSMLVNQRSADMFLGVPFNIASYALLTHMLAQVCKLEVGELIWRGGDVHIYQNHIKQIKTQIQRAKDGLRYKLPSISLNLEITDIDDFTFDDILLHNYVNAGKITGAVAV